MNVAAGYDARGLVGCWGFDETGDEVLDGTGTDVVCGETGGWDNRSWSVFMEAFAVEKSGDRWLRDGTRSSTARSRSSCGNGATSAPGGGAGASRGASSDLNERSPVHSGSIRCKSRVTHAGA